MNAQDFARFVSEVQINANLALPLVLEMEGNPNKTGAYLTVMGDINSDETDTYRIFPVGNVDLYTPFQRVRYSKLSFEKAYRLYKNKSLPLSHRSSVESRDESSNMFGGAILADGYIFSCSALSEIADEALSLSIAVSMELLRHHPDAVDIARISNNQMFLHPSMELNRFLRKF